MEANLAVLIDFENIAAGTEKEGLGRFDIEALLKRLKDKGRILVARSYGDWGRFARFKQALLTSNVTMMELTSHGMQDKNRADIALVVDCLELAFTKPFVDTFVIVSGDSDFTPLVLKMRELNKRVIGCGTRQATSRLLIQACDEFLFYDTILKENRSELRRAPETSAIDEEAAFELVVDVLEGLQRENPDPPHASIVKTAMLRKSPDFNEVDLGFGTFARFLELAQDKGYIRISRDRKSGGYRVDSADAQPLPDEAPQPSRESREHRGEHRGARHESDGARGGDQSRGGVEEDWLDPYLPDGAAETIKVLSAHGKNPLASATRMAILTLIEQIVDERRKKRRRNTLQFVSDDVKKRLKKSHPDIPPQAVRAVFQALLEAGLLLHKDGKPIRTHQAPFELGKNADRLNEKLTEHYLRVLRDSGASVDDSGLLAEIFFGNAERRRKIEETVSWLTSGGDTDEDDDNGGPVPDLDALSLDDLLLADDDVPAAPQESAPSDASAPVVEEEAPAPAAEEDEPKKKRRRTRSKKDDEKSESVEAMVAAGNELNDLDALLESS